MNHLFPTRIYYFPSKYFSLVEIEKCSRIIWHLVKSTLKGLDISVRDTNTTFFFPTQKILVPQSVSERAKIYAVLSRKSDEPKAILLQ